MITKTKHPNGDVTLTLTSADAQQAEAIEKALLVVDRASQLTGLSSGMILGRARNAHVVAARFACIGVIRKRILPNVVQIGRIFGRCFATVDYALDRVRCAPQCDRNLAELTEALDTWTVKHVD